MSSSKNLGAVQLALLAMIHAANTTFAPLEIPALHSTQCGAISVDMSHVLKTVQQMLSNPTPSSHPLSCLEVRESYPSSPSGYYTLSDGPGNTTVVYCNMDDLYSCPSLEQALRGIQLSLNHTTSAITSQLDSSQDAITSQLDSSQAVSITISTAINSTVNDVLKLSQKLIKLHSPASCQEALDKAPDITTGTYTLSNEMYPNEFDVYCHFEDLCNTSGPWTRVAFLNMSDSTQNCSTGFKLYSYNGERACGRQHPLPSNCLSVEFPVYSMSYSQVCGRLIGYQYYSIDGFNSGYSIDGQYVDGISLTHGSPRQHIWTFAAEQYITGSISCPCAGGNSPPAFVGSDYYCESGSNVGGSLTQTLYTSDPLWDGQGCVGGEAACCNAPGIPWFHKVLDTPTTDYIELRICGHGDEDAPLSLYEIYVQ